MSHYRESDCVGCPQGCIRCGREIDYDVWECDECGESTFDYDEFEHDGRNDYCPECYEMLFGKDDGE